MGMQRHTGTRALAGFMLAGLLAGCGLFGTDPPTEARLRLDGTTGTGTVLVVSTNFLSQRQALFDADGLYRGDTLLVQLFEADTFNVVLPFEQTYDIRTFSQFFAHIRRLDPQGDSLRARLWIDGRLRSDQQPGTHQDSVLIVYNFRSRIIEPDDDNF